MKSIEFGRQLCGDIDGASQREWLTADGVGGYAMGSVSGLRTRRYHGLLIVSGERISGRHLGLAALDPVLVIGDQRIELATHEWSSGVVAPSGHRHLASFALVEGVPRWRWAVGDVLLQMEVASVRGRPAVGVCFRLLRSDHPVQLDIGALCTWRDVHGERRAGPDPATELVADGFTFENAYRVRGPGYEPGGEWYRDVHYREEQNRGLNATEDLWHAGSFSTQLASGESAHVESWAGDLESAPPAAPDIIEQARTRARTVAKQAQPTDDIDASLAVACDQFIVEDPQGFGPTVVAGYPWFGNWSRDTMISYPGLFLETRRWDEGRALLTSAGATLSEGMLANTADTGTLEYNTVDATLWFVHAVGRHVATTQDVDLAAELLPDLDQIVEHHCNGTRFGIRVDPDDGLITQGVDGVALTWMDARIDGTAVTPRIGKPVEINALWIHALASLAELHTLVGSTSPQRVDLEDQARWSFQQRFVKANGSLVDVIDGPSAGDEVRPNQLLATALPYGPHVDPAVVHACSPLVTSIGMRSLDPQHPSYQPFHQGGPAERDHAYHQGTVWPWLLGPYVEAACRVGIDASGFLDDVEPHLSEYGIGSVSETADGAPPHRATGCPFQAWSVAEVFRTRRLAQAQAAGKG